jgi:DNA-binding response OmpR family regulator
MDGPATIVVAEDEGSVARTVAAQLEPAGHIVHWVRTVRDARSRLREERTDLLLLDVALETDGLEFFQAVRFAPEAPRGGVVVLADREDVQVRERAHQLGAAAVLAKPLRPDELTLVVRELLEVI